MSAVVLESLPLYTAAKTPISASAYALGKLYIGFEDGSLRVLSGKEEGVLTHAKPTLDGPSPVTVAQFTKKREPVRCLQALPQWNGSLLSLGEAGVLVHSLVDPSKAPSVVPGSGGCRGFSACPRAGLLLVYSRSTVTVMAWVGKEGGVGGGTLSDFQRIASHTLVSPGEECITGATSCGGGLMALTVTHKQGSKAQGCGAGAVWAGSSGEEEVGGGNGRSSPSNSQALSPSFLEEGVEVDDLPKVFLPFGGREEGAEDGSGDGRPSGGSSSSSASSSSSSSSSSLTGAYALTFFVLHAWTGRVVRVVMGGGVGEAEAGAAVSSGTGGSWRGGVGRGGNSFFVTCVLPTGSSTATLAFEIDVGVEGEGGMEGNTLPLAVEAEAVGGSTPSSASNGNTQVCAFCGVVIPYPPPASCSTCPPPPNPMQSLMDVPPLVFLEGVATPPSHLLPLKTLPYLLAATPTGVQVYTACRTMQSALLQGVAFPGLMHMGECEGVGGASGMGGYTLLTSRTTIHLLRPLLPIMQVAALQSSRPPHYQTAMALCADPATAVSAPRARAIREEYGRWLWSQCGDFEGALREFSCAGVGVEEVLQLYPQLLPGKGVRKGGEGGGSTANNGNASSSTTTGTTPFPLAPAEPSFVPSSNHPGGGGMEHPDLGGGSSSLLPAALAPLPHFLATHTSASSSSAAFTHATPLLHALLWLRNHARFRHNHARASQYQGAILGVLRRTPTFPVESTRGLLAEYGVATGAGGADGLELAALYHGAGYFEEEAACLAGEVERREGGAAVSESGASPAAAAAASAAALLSAMGGKFMPQILPSLLLGGVGLEGALSALATLCTSLHANPSGWRGHWEGCVSRLEELEGSTSPPTSAPGSHVFWYLSGGGGAGQQRQQNTGAPWVGGAENLEEEAQCYPLTRGAWIRGVQRVFLEETLLNAHSAPLSATTSCLSAPLLSTYLATIGEVIALTGSEPAPRVGDEGGLLGQYRRRAIHVLTHHPPLLDTIPALLAGFEGVGGLAEERVLLLALAGRHTEALTLARQAIPDPLFTTAYCERYGAFEELVGVVGPGWVEDAAISSLLLQHLGGGGVSAFNTLASLPDSTPLASIQTMALAGLGKGEEWARACAAEAAVASVNRDRALREWAGKRARFVQVDKDSGCAVCGRKLAVKGGAPGVEWALGVVAVILKGGKKAHVGCL